jgi:hypothetical protein
MREGYECSGRLWTPRCCARRCGAWYAPTRGAYADAVGVGRLSLLSTAHAGGRAGGGSEAWCAGGGRGSTAVVPRASSAYRVA